jgi:hypothetical protein
LDVPGGGSILLFTLKCSCTTRTISAGVDNPAGGRSVGRWSQTFIVLHIYNIDMMNYFSRQSYESRHAHITNAHL